MLEVESDLKGINVIVVISFRAKYHEAEETLDS